MGIIASLIIGAIAGWLGGLIYKGSWLLGSVLHISLGDGWIGSIITGAIGAVVILFLLNIVFGKKK